MNGRRDARTAGALGGAPSRATGCTLCVVDPPPRDGPWARKHGGLKLDWHSDVGRLGALLEWWPVGRDGDAGVPLPVAGALAAGLAKAATVVGCTLDVPADATDAWTPAPGGHAVRFATHRWLGVGPRPLGLLATQVATVAERFFDDRTFAWSNESQLLLLAPPGTLPRVDRALVEACFAVPVRVGASALRERGVVGLVVAGVDGALAGFYPLDPAWRARAVRALADAAAAAGVRWEERTASAHWAGVTAAGGRP